ncbi:hypothetical protein ACT91Q_22275 [Brevibacillus thermoruber]|jgi:hypothetical protein|uniref:hypothetical protein n=1 Tax=Brevibacillus thermoruber TaxID=33942 RepID=UPI00404354DB
MKKILSLVTTFALLCQVILVPASARTAESETIKNVEAYSIETLSDEPNDDGLFEVTGYKQVNAITEITADANQIKTKMFKVEDYYDRNSNYINTVVTSEEFENDYNTGEAKAKKQTKQYDKAMTISVNKSEKNTLSSTDLTNTKRISVQKNVELAISALDEAEFKPVPGIKKADLEKVKKIAAKIKESDAVKFNTETKHIEIDEKKLASLASTEAAGAFDNFYNHNLSTGAFTAQALGVAGHKYIRVTGSTVGSSKNASSMVAFKKSINEYEYYIITKMKYNLYSETFDWFLILMGLGAIVAGFGTGPAGWVAIVTSYAGALGTFTALTSKAYATAERLDLSRNAAKFCQSAREIILNYPKNFENYNVTVVSGY